MRPASISHLSRILLVLVLAAIASPLTLPAQDTSPRAEMRIRDLEDKVARLEAVPRPTPAPTSSTKSDVSGAGAVLFLFGAFCALWAQNTRRNPWLWFFLGIFFHIITVLFLLTKNANDRKYRS